jgi:hypothetical protein
MARYQFALNSAGETQAGIVQSDSFAEAMQLLGERMEIQTGDTLEIGVFGFPPARYECIAAVDEGDVLWRPAGLMAA